MELFREEYWSRLPFPSPGDLPDPGMQPGTPALQADSLPSEPPGKPFFLIVLYLLFEFAMDPEKKKKKTKKKTTLNTFSSVCIIPVPNTETIPTNEQN